MGRKLIFAAVPLLAVGCSWTSDGSDGSDAANVASNGVDYRQRVADMPEERRNALLLQAIIGAGLPCQAVESSRPGADSAGAPAWKVNCTGGRERTVIIAANGSARIIDDDPPEPPAPATAVNSQ